MGSRFLVIRHAKRYKYRNAMSCQGQELDLRHGISQGLQFGLSMRSGLLIIRHAKRYKHRNAMSCQDQKLDIRHGISYDW